MPTIAVQIMVIVLLSLLNGFFAMSETALVSSRKARLRQRAVYDQKQGYKVGRCSQKFGARQKF